MCGLINNAGGYLLDVDREFRRELFRFGEAGLLVPSRANKAATGPRGRHIPLEQA